MRSKDRIVSVTKTKGLGVYPTYILLAHRHLEKANPDVPIGIMKSRTYNMPIELLGVGGFIPQEMIDQIDSIELVYQERV